MIKTFISHSSEDDFFVDWLGARLQKDFEELDIFIDHWSDLKGEHAQIMIEEVKNSPFFFSILSNSYISTTFCVNERKTAVDNENTYEFPILLKIDRDKIPDDLLIKFKTTDQVQGKIWFDFSDQKNWESEYEYLVKAIINVEIKLDLLIKKDFYQDCEHIDMILDRELPTTNELKTMFDVYLKRQEFQKYFFYRLNNISWLKYFKIYGFLKSVPKPIKEKNSTTYYIPHWPILDYLMRISESFLDKPDVVEKYSSSLFEIMNDVTTQGADNFRIWWHFIKILCNIPIKHIPNDIIELIPLWFNSQFGVDIMSQEVLIKFFPKFFPEGNGSIDIEKVEQLVDYLTRIKWIKIPDERNIDYLGKTEEPRMIIDYYWLLQSFINDRNADKIGEKCTDKIIYLLANRLKEIFRRQYPKHWLDIDINKETYRLTVYHTDDFEFTCSIGIVDTKVLKNVKPEEELLRIATLQPTEIMQFKISGCRNSEQFSMHIQKTISSSDLSSELKRQISKDLLCNFYKDIYRERSYIWYKSLTQGPHYMSGQPEVVLTHIISRMLLARAQVDQANTLQIFKKFSSEEYQFPFFSRFQYYIVGEYWEDYKDSFWEQINMADNYDFEDPNFEAEIYYLLKRNIDKFTIDEKKKIIGLIEKGPIRYKPEEDTTKYINFWKQKWLSAVKNDQFFTDLYNKQKEITQSDEELHFQDQETRVGPGPSPLSQEEIKTMSNGELAKYLSIFKTKDFWKGPTVGGLGESLRVLAQATPEKFVDDFTPFMNTSYFYIYHILVGIDTAWGSKQPFEWGKLLSFLHNYVNRKSFWIDEYTMYDDGWEVNHNWVIWEIGDLIQHGTRSDDWAFEYQYMHNAEELVVLMLRNPTITTDKRVAEDFISQTRNSYGILLTTLLYIVLRKLRKKEKQNKTDVEKSLAILKSNFERAFISGIPEAYTIFGEYLVNFYYLDRQWSEMNIEKIKEIDNETLWQAFIKGYFLHKVVYHDLYKIMYNHYTKAISITFTDEHLTENLAYHLAIGYINRLEEISELSLIGTTIEKLRHRILHEIIHCYWLRRNRLADTKEKSTAEDQIKNKRIIAFWRRLFEKLHDKSPLTDNDKKVLSETAKLAMYLPKIDEENIKWLMLLLPYVNHDSNVGVLIDSLDYLKDTGDAVISAKYIGEILLKMLETYVPAYKQEETRSIVQHLADTDDAYVKVLAKQIIDIYSRNNLHFLRDIWEQLQEN